MQAHAGIWGGGACRGTRCENTFWRELDQNATKRRKQWGGYEEN